MQALYIDLVLFKLFNYLDLKEIINFSMTSKYFNSIFKDQHNIKMLFFKKNINQLNYKKILIAEYLKHKRNKCLICHNYLFEDVFITFHKCQTLKKCLNCQNKKCICDNLTIYHKKCINLKNENIFSCFICNTKVTGYNIKYLV